jgi:hypothetical protein
MKNFKAKALFLIGTFLSFALVSILRINNSENSFYFSEVANADAVSTTESTTSEGGSACCGSGGCGCTASDGTGSGVGEGTGK